jgi:hypothetical protein
MFYISGKTFQYRDQLKALGCKWHPETKSWTTGNPATAKQADSYLGLAVTSDGRPTGPVEDIRIEYPSRGATYYDEEYGVYKYSKYPKSSVLAGQQCRQFLGAYITLELAQAAHPTALLAQGCGFREPFVNHLPGEE